MRQHIENLINFQIENKVITTRDYVYVKNQLYTLLNIEFNNEIIKPIKIKYPSDSLEPILDILEETKVLDGLVVSRDLFDTKIMNIFASLPSTIQSNFDALSITNNKEATKWMYNYAKSLNYIRTNRTDKNIAFKENTKYGELEITINLSKPEKDPKSIALASKAKAVEYPKCVLCMENEGFSGNFNRESRDQHRLIQFEIDNKEWYFQYSPYIYYNEHAIIFSGKHEPMSISELTFKRLVSLTKKFDGYFFGSNADLPIVGGSILSHEHYQGGNYEFPIESASTLYETNSNDVTIKLLNWPLSTIRLRSTNEDNLLNIANKVLSNWREYNNEELNIRAFTNTTPHHTITPIARIKDNMFELDLILRDNQTNELHPMGVYHPHEDKWNIKKENIGLIEAIGLAILPGRLKDELESVKSYLVNNTKLDEQSIKHEAWANSFKDIVTKENIDQVINKKLAETFASILEDCGVFKLDKEGINAFKAFIDEVIK